MFGVRGGGWREGEGGEIGGGGVGMGAARKKENVTEIREACNEEFGKTSGRKRKALKETRPIREKMKSECLQILGEKTPDFRRAQSSYLQEAYGMSEHSKPSAHSVQELPQLATQRNHRGALKPRDPGPHPLPKSFTALVSGVAWLLGFTGFPGDSSRQPGLTTRSSDFWKRKEFKFLEHCIIPLTIVWFSRSVVSNSLQPMDCSTPGFPVHHQPQKLAQTHVHRVSETIPTISSSVIPFSYLQSFH